MAPVRVAWAYARAACFYVGAGAAAVFFAPLCLSLWPAPYRARSSVSRGWTRFSLWWLRMTCGLSFEVEGRERIPRTAAAIIACKHQSAWETLALQVVFPPLTFVLRKDLLSIPFFGWGLATTEPVAIDRRAEARALRQILEQGAARLERGIWLAIFPEGTRMPPGERGRYQLAAGLLAERTGRPLVPVAHNAGRFWPRYGFLKRPGTIRLAIGPAIDSRGKSARQIVCEAEDWIEHTCARLPAGPHRISKTSRAGLGKA